jgi:tRNA-splicing ligase RtcB
MTDDSDDVREYDGIRLERVREHVWEIPREGDMRVPARVLASDALLEQISDDKTLQQLRNATHLPGITGHAVCMPDGHQGYGFPVGGVGATDVETGCISPGSIGYDINCGVRMMRTNLTYDDLRGHEEELVNALFSNIPSGLGGGGVVESDRATLEQILDRGVDWALEHGYAVEDDLTHCEDEGMRPDADPSAVSQKAKDRGKNQIGSLGSGNHFLEVQRVTDVYRSDVAAEFGLEEDQVVVLIHCGSRGLGHQICSDYLRKIEQEHGDLLAELPDKELAAAPAGSALAEEYYGAMCAAINFAWVNRQLIMHRTRRVFERVFDRDWEEMEMELLYDVAHNIGKKEVHEVAVDADGHPTNPEDAVDRAERELYVHRKGATRAFPAGRPEIPSAYRDVGQPIIIPGSMGAGSYVLRGGEHSMELSFGSTAHGAGRTMSRTQAKSEFWGETVQEELRDQQKIYVKAQSGATVAEEAPGVYKDVDEVVRVSDELGIGDKVARTFPVCNIKG